MKKRWERPELIVLTKSQPEEMVLQGCKAPGVGFGYGADGCIRGIPDFSTDLGPCDAILGT